MIETNVIGGLLPDIPRIYTALSEWLACLVMVSLLPLKLKGKRRWAYLAGFLAFQCTFLCLTADVQGILWILCMVAAFAAMCFSTFMCSSVSFHDAVFYSTIAFTFAEFAASLEWQLYCYISAYTGNKGMPVNIAILSVSYLILFAGVYILIKKRYKTIGAQSFTRREVLITLFMGILIFALSNIGFVAINSPFGQRKQIEVFNARTLVDLAGAAIMCAYFSQKENLQARFDLQRLENIIKNQYLMYQQSQETIEIINYKYHDLKHHIIALRAEEDKANIDRYLDQMEEEIHTYEAQNKTGNKVLDTMLSSKSIVCSKNHIGITTVVDGKVLDFMKTLDICSIFGNALDNAIEYEKTVEDAEKRLIHVNVYSKRGFVMIKFQNYYSGDENGHIKELKTTKTDKELHGFGVKSIYHTVHNYNGEVDINIEDHWFNMNILIPIPAPKSI